MVQMIKNIDSHKLTRNTANFMNDYIFSFFVVHISSLDFMVLKMFFPPCFLIRCHQVLCESCDLLNQNLTNITAPKSEYVIRRCFPQIAGDISVQLS